MPFYMVVARSAQSHTVRSCIFVRVSVCVCVRVYVEYALNAIICATQCDRKIFGVGNQCLNRVLWLISSCYICKDCQKIKETKHAWASDYLSIAVTDEWPYIHVAHTHNFSLHHGCWQKFCEGKSHTFRRFCHEKEKEIWWRETKRVQFNWLTIV